jgi:hypothetical protein
LGVGISGRREDISKRCRRVNVVEVSCTLACKQKNETFPRNVGRRDKEE